MRILVTDSDNRSALAAVRSLGKLGHTVIVGGERHPSLASVSRYCSEFVEYSSPQRDPDGFVASVMRLCAEKRIDMVLPMTEITTLLLTAHQHALPEGTKLPFSNAAAVATAANKADVLALASRLGVPIPRTVVCESLAGALEKSGELQYPVVMKSSRSRVWTGDRWLSTSVRYAADQQTFERHARNIPEAVYPLLLQERIEGPGVGVFLCCDETGVVASFAHRRIREKPPSGGVSVLCESTLPDPAALEHATRLLEALQWRGVAMVEFKRDLGDGSLKLMEINGRFWGSLQLAIDAGVNFPALMVDICTGHHPQKPLYAVGARTRWLLGDVDSLVTVLMRGRRGANLPPSHPGRIRTLMSFFSLVRPGRLELERLDDLAPARLAFKRWLAGDR